MCHTGHGLAHTFVCDAVLGVGIVNGKCATISGCEAPGYELFKNMASCKEACLSNVDK